PPRMHHWRCAAAPCSRGAAASSGASALPRARYPRCPTRAARRWRPWPGSRPRVRSTTATKRPKPRWPRSRSSCASRRCCCTATARSARGIASSCIEGPWTGMKPLTGIDGKEFARRRRQLMRMAGEEAILVLPAAPERIRSRDTHYPYRQDSDLWYLSGFPEPEAVLVLVPGRANGETILFCRDRDPEREGWDGPRCGPEGAVERFGMDDAYPIDDLDEILPGLLEGRTRVYYHFGRDTEFDLKLI